MSITYITNVPFPPAGVQITTGPGTLQGAVIAPPAVPNFTGSAPIDASFFDSIGPTANAPIATVRTQQGYAPVVLSAAYTTGLYCVQRSGSSLTVTHS
jgi:hypothetical protein